MLLVLKFLLIIFGNVIKKVYNFIILTFNNNHIQSRYPPDQFHHPAYLEHT